jgi:hypothetical protein
MTIYDSAWANYNGYKYRKTGRKRWYYKGEWVGYNIKDVHNHAKKIGLE